MPMPPKQQAILHVRKTAGCGEADKGKLSCIEVEDAKGVRVLIMIPYQLEGEFLARLQGASLTAARTRGGQPDKSLERALIAEEIHAGVTDNHGIGLRMKLAIGMTLDVVLTDEAIAGFQRALAELETYRKSGGPKGPQ